MLHIRMDPWLYIFLENNCVSHSDKTRFSVFCYSKVKEIFRPPSVFDSCDDIVTYGIDTHLVATGITHQLISCRRFTQQ